MGTYLLTGVAGFIGARVAELLLAAGQSVVGVDNLNNTYDVRMKQWRLQQITSHPGFRFERLDVTDRAALADLFNRQTQIGLPGFDAVLNLAARAGVRRSVSDPWAYFEANVGGTLNLLDLCRQHGIPKFVLSSSSSVYGARTEVPYREEQATDHPLSPYAASKKAAEALCYTYHYLHGIDVTVFRYFTVYGPAGRPDMMPFRFVQWISEGHPLMVYGDGTQSRDFTYVDDIARGTIAGLAPLGYEVVNLGSDRPVILADAIHLIERLVGKTADIRNVPFDPADVRGTWADIQRAGRLLQWRPAIDIEQGFTALVQWYQANRTWAKDIDTH